MQCSNHFKQFGLAIHNYHDAFNSMPSATGAMSNSPAAYFNGTYTTPNPAPPGVTVGEGGRANQLTMWSAMAFVLPFMEQTARYEAIRQASNIDGTNLMPYQGCNEAGVSQGGRNGVFAAGTITPENIQLLRSATGGTIPTLLCPSDPYSSSPGRNYLARTNVFLCRGDAVDSTFFSVGETAGAQFRAGSRGVFAPHTWKSFGAVSDGTSNTIAAGESCTASNTEGGGSPEIKGGTYLTVADLGGSVRDGCVLLARRDSKALNTPLAGNWRGHWFSDGRAVTTGFSTVVQPNGPNCATGGDSVSTATIFTAQSYHTGGVNILRLDGSVTFVSDTINNANLSNPDGTPVGRAGPTAGPSPYGIWGALGSIAGGESASFP